MKALVVRAPGQYAVEEVPVPAVPAGGMLVRVIACALCGSDLRTLRSGHRRVTFPWIIGHEICGTLVETGPRYKGPWRIGELLAVGPLAYCGICEFCLAERFELCTGYREIAQAWPGGLAELPGGARGMRAPRDDTIGAGRHRPGLCCDHRADVVVHQRAGEGGGRRGGHSRCHRIRTGGVHPRCHRPHQGCGARVRRRPERGQAGICGGIRSECAHRCLERRPGGGCDAAHRRSRSPGRDLRCSLCAGRCAVRRNGAEGGGGFCCSAASRRMRADPVST